ncbi:MAG TPA: YetF domain-containing protein [Gemmatimonadaceae bacterium]|jgi:uncharacterized membrane protein YcaP (DUF421 family)|nr:YetF domain-containing protein [Gemmatimonadaceae bacterium]
MFFHSWSDLLRVCITTAVTFVVVIAALRLVGTQALARMSGYDMVATVTLGTIVAGVSMNTNVTVTDGVVALMTLLVLQEGIRTLQSRWRTPHYLARQQPLVLLWDGVLLEDRLRGNRISADEVRAAIRGAGLASFSEARLVVIENDGGWSVIPKRDQVCDDSALLGLAIPGRPDNSRDGLEGARARPASPERIP